MHIENIPVFQHHINYPYVAAADRTQQIQAYILQRVQEHGSEMEKAEKSIVIHFDRTAQLSWTWAKSIEDFIAIER